MDADRSIHPTAEALQAYSLGRLDEAATEVVRQHLADCPGCRIRVNEVTASGSAIPAGLPTEATAADAAIHGPVSSPVMSSTGQVDATSEAVNSDAEPTLESGTRVGYFGDYELLKVLGEGGMGIVYQARQLSLNRPVALKMIKASRFPCADEVRRFQNEAEAVARLDHPNIVPIFEVGRYEDQHYFSMKLVAGESLDKRLNDYVADPRRAAGLMVTTAEAILHAHQRGILHRDLKPANILVDSTGQPHISDFGLAKRIDGDSELTRSGAIVGTPAYMAPEQASGSRGAITTSTDVYGLGAILYALLTGRAPFGGTSVLEVLQQVRERTPGSPRKLNARVPRDLEVISLKCMEKDPRQRYASADAFAEDLKRWLAGEPIAARPVGGMTRLWMWCRRNPVVSTAAGLAAVALVVVAVLALLYARQQSQLARARTLYANEQNRRVSDQIEATNKISGLNKNLEKERQDLKASLTDSNRRLAMVFFERAQRAFDSGQINHGLLWLVETWRYALQANDPAWQNLARTNLSFWRYNCPEIKWIFSEFVALDPTGKMLVTQHGEGDAQLWDVATCKPIGEPMAHRGKVKAVAFSPDHTTILTTTHPSTAQLWDARSGHPIGKPIVIFDSGYFSPDSKTVFTYPDSATVLLWDSATGRSIGSPIKYHSGLRAWFSPNGKTFFTGVGRRWDAASGKSLLPGPARSYDDEFYWTLAISRDGKSVLVRDPSRKTCRLWDTVTEQFVGRPMEHKQPVQFATFSADGKTVATLGSEMFEAALVQLWEVATGLPIGPSSAHDHVTDVFFSPDGKTVAVVSFFPGRVQLLDAGTGLPVSKPLEHQAPLYSVAFSPNGKVVLTASHDTRLWDAATGQPLGEPMLHNEGIGWAAFCVDGSFVLTLGGGNHAKLWKLFTDRAMGLPLEVLHLAGPIEFSTDGNTLRMPEKDESESRLWDAATWSPIAKLPVTQSNGAEGGFRPFEAKFIELSADKAAGLWHRATGPVGGTPVGPEGVFMKNSFAPNARHLSAAHSHDGESFLTLATVNAPAFHATLRLWNAATNQPIGQSFALRDSWCTGFSPDMKTILSVSDDHRARLTDTVTGRPIGPPLVHPTSGGLGGPIDFAVFSPDGKTVATSSNTVGALLGRMTANSTVRIWRLPSILEDDFPRLEAWVQTLTGLAADGDGNVHSLDTEGWLARRERLRQLGGQPKSDSRWLVDPILYGADPTARGRAWTERKRWVEAEAAFSEVVRARPLRSSAWRERARFYVMRSEPEKAAGDFLKALALGDRSPQLFAEISASERVVDCLLTLYPEDAIELSTDFLFRTAEYLWLQGRSDEASAALVRVARPSAAADWAVPLGLPYPAGHGVVSKKLKLSFSNTRGVALYRAGRFEDAIRRLKEGIEARNEAEESLDWIFLAMANHRLGHRAEARRWLDLLRSRQPSNDRNPSWDQRVILVLRSEAEAAILYDPVFPSDPFAH